MTGVMRGLWGEIGGERRREESGDMGWCDGVREEDEERERG